MRSGLPHSARHGHGVDCTCIIQPAPDFSLLESLLQTVRGKRVSVSTRQSNGLLMIIDRTPRDKSPEAHQLEPKKAGEAQGPSACESALRKMRVVDQGVSFAACSEMPRPTWRADATTSFCDILGD